MSAVTKINLTETPKVVIWPETHYVYIEKFGPFQETAPEAWGEIGQLLPSILKLGKITGKMTLHKPETKPMTYRAGYALDSRPPKLPEGLKYEKFEGGKYSCFVLKGPYTNLPMACGRVSDIVEETKLKRRDDFCIQRREDGSQARGGRMSARRSVSLTKSIDRRANSKQRTVNNWLVPQSRDQPKKGKHEHKCNNV